MYTCPVVPFSATRWDIKGKTVLEVYLDASPIKPHAAPDHNDNYRAYIRVADEIFVLLLSWQKRKRKSGLLLPFSRPVKQLMNYLENHPYIHIRHFCRLARIKHTTAQDILSDLIAINTLKYIMVDKQIVYTMADCKSIISNRV